MTSTSTHKSYQRNIAASFLIEDDAEKLARLLEIIGTEMSALLSNRRFSDSTYALMRKKLSSGMTYILIVTVIDLQHLQDDVYLNEYEIEGVADAYFYRIQRVADKICGVVK